MNIQTKNPSILEISEKDTHLAQIYIKQNYGYDINELHDLSPFGV
jgi:hypothetical protein